MRCTWCEGCPRLKRGLFKVRKRGRWNLFIDKAFSDGHLRLDQSGRVEKIVYAAANRSERWSDPEEKVRAEFYAELIYRY